MNIAEARQLICDFLNDITKVEEFTNKMKLERKDDKWMPSEKPALKDIEKRAVEFGKSLIPHVEKYGKEMVREFYDYWTEPNRSGTKMLFETKQTWDLSRRLDRWQRNNNDKKQKTIDASQVMGRRYKQL